MNTFLAIGFLLTACSSSYFSIRFIKEKFKNQQLLQDNEDLYMKLVEKTLDGMRVEILQMMMDNAVDNDNYELAEEIFNKIKSIQKNDK